MVQFFTEINSKVFYVAALSRKNMQKILYSTHLKYDKKNSCQQVRRSESIIDIRWKLIILWAIFVSFTPICYNK